MLGEAKEQKKNTTDGKCTSGFIVEETGLGQLLHQEQAGTEY